MSPLNRFLTTRQPVWVRILAALGMILIALSAAAMDGLLGRILVGGFWRAVLLPVVVLLYIWIVSPFVDRGQEEVVRRFRPIVQLDDAAFERLVNQ